MASLILLPSQLVSAVCPWVVIFFMAELTVVYCLNAAEGNDLVLPVISSVSFVIILPEIIFRVF